MIKNYPDPIDQAAENTQAYVDQALANRIPEEYPEPEWIGGQPHCAECGALMPIRRAQLGYGRCIDCQQQREERG